jgi:hypothetical protein
MPQSYERGTTRTRAHRQIRRLVVGLNVGVPRPGAARNGLVVTEAVRTGDFEANMASVVGLDQRSPLAVTFLEDPLRLVVDIVP